MGVGFGIGSHLWRRSSTGGDDVRLAFRSTGVPRPPEASDLWARSADVSQFDSALRCGEVWLMVSLRRSGKLCVGQNSTVFLGQCIHFWSTQQRKTHQKKDWENEERVFLSLERA